MTRDEKPIRVCLLTIGSRGDVQPFLLLSKYLQEDPDTKWQPVIVTHENYRAWINAQNVEFSPITRKDVDMESMIYEPTLACVILSGDTGKLGELMRESPEDEADSMEDIEAACIDADLIVANQVMVIKAGIVGEKLGIPTGFWFPYPSYPTNQFAHPLFAVPDSRLWNQVTHRFVDYLTWKTTRSLIDSARSKLNLPPIRSTKEYRRWIDERPAFHAYSPAVLPSADNWPSHVTVGGFIRDQGKIDSTELDADLERFISKEHGDQRPVVYLGFGSMPVAGSEAFQNLLKDIDAELERSGKQYRFVVFIGKCTPQSDAIPLTLPGEYMFPVVSVSHSTLFPRCDFILHHGGAGTTAAALVSGTPSAVIPVFFDQVFWAKRTRQILNGPKIVKFQDLSAKKLLKTIEDGLSLTNEAKRAADLVAKENGLEAARQWLLNIKV